MDTTFNKSKSAWISVPIGTSSVMTMVYKIIQVTLYVINIGKVTVIFGVRLGNSLIMSRSDISYIFIWGAFTICWWITIPVVNFLVWLPGLWHSTMFGSYFRLFTLLVCIIFTFKYSILLFILVAQYNWFI